MKISNDDKCYVWIWLPNKVEPVVCGKLESKSDKYEFYYAPSYVKKLDAIKLSNKMRLTTERYIPNHLLHGVFRDALPDAWGQRVLQHLHGTLSISQLDMLLLSSSDRIGALHFQIDPATFHSQFEENATLEQLQDAAKYIEKGIALPKFLDIAIAHGTSIGGARPKALIEADDKKYIAKFSSSTDLYPVVQTEYAAMYLAKQVGINVAPVKLVEVKGKSVLLIERFDREKIDGGWSRKFMVSALTILGLDELEARYTSYLDVADFIRKETQMPNVQLLELFRRMVFNILVGNTDDHAKNHAFFWDGNTYQLTPAYDICLYPRAGQEATQAMIVGEEGRFSRLTNALSGAEHFQLTESEAREEIDQVIDAIQQYWPEAADHAKLTKLQRDQFKGTSILNPFCLYGYSI